MTKYDHQAIEAKWAKIWEDQGLYNTPTDVTKENKQYVLPQLPYPSGAGLHVGHAEIYCACDIYARYLRMKGKKVLQVIGWDAFGLPAENYAIKTNIHPRINTDKAIENFISQIKSLGVSVDWSHTTGSHEPEYYKWTQWFFLLMYERGLAYRKKQAVNWCDTDKTVLANEQVIGGKCERCGSEVVQREMEQWFLKITEYADRLIDDLDRVDWPTETIKRQRDWIGRSEGALVKFKLKSADAAELSEVEVFTTRPDTIFGATVMVLAPEHTAMDTILSAVTNRKEVDKYIEQATHKSELERQQEREKTGVQLQGLVAINPANGAEIPVYVADYVLATYGTGAIMSVPGHDERDLEFAMKFNIPVKTVVHPVGEAQNYVLIVPTKLLDENPQFNELAQNHKFKKNEFGFWEGLTIENAGDYSALITASLAMVQEMQTMWLDAKISDTNDKVTTIWEGKIHQFDIPAWIELMQISRRKEDKPEMFEKYELQTWELWMQGGSFQTLLQKPQIHEQLLSSEMGIAANSGEFSGQTSSEAKKNITKWLEEQGVAKSHKTYKLRDWSVSRQRFWGAPVPMVYDPEGNIYPVKQEDLPVILPDDVDFKPTGQSPLTYSPSFQGKVEEIYGAGWKREVDTLDTFMCSSWYYFRYLDPHNSEAFASPEMLKTWMPVDFYLGGTEHINGHLLYSRFFTKVLFDAGYIDFDEPFSVHRHQGTIFGPDGRKMSKRYGNVINPTDVVYLHGGDTIRIYEMFMGPLDQDKAWNPEAASGVRRFLQRIYDFNEKLVAEKRQDQGKMSLDSTIKKLSEDIPNLKFNTAVSELMKTLNTFEADADKVSLATWEEYLKLLAPFAPFITEELWSNLGHTDSIHLQPWPEYDEKNIATAELRVTVQVNGKVRDTIVLSKPMGEAEVLEIAKSAPKIAKYLEGVEIKNVIYVPGRLLNIVIA